MVPFPKWRGRPQPAAEAADLSSFEVYDFPYEPECIRASAERGSTLDRILSTK